MINDNYSNPTKLPYPSRTNQLKTNVSARLQRQNILPHKCKQFFLLELTSRNVSLTRVSLPGPWRCRRFLAPVPPINYTSSDSTSKNSEQTKVSQFELKSLREMAISPCPPPPNHFQVVQPPIRSALQIVVALQAIFTLTQCSFPARDRPETSVYDVVKQHISCKVDRNLSLPTTTTTTTAAQRLRAQGNLTRMVLNCCLIVLTQYPVCDEVV